MSLLHVQFPLKLSGNLRRRIDAHQHDLFQDNDDQSIPISTMLRSAALQLRAMIITLRSTVGAPRRP